MTSPNDPQRTPIIFDGSDRSFSVTDFLFRIACSADGVTSYVSLDDKNLEHLISSRLYGEALRYYENLDPECQQDYEQLRDALTQRFPVSIRSGGIAQHATAQGDQSWLLTPAEAPPLTSPQLALPQSAVAYPGGSDVKPTEKRGSTHLRDLTRALRVPFLSMSSAIPRNPPVRAHCLFIERNRGNGDSTRITTLDLSDQGAVKIAQKSPLAIVPPNQAVHYQVGFTYSMYGEEDIDFCHHVLAPRAYSKIKSYREVVGLRSASPEGARTDASWISGFLGGKELVCSPGTYVIKSSIRTLKYYSFDGKEWEGIGAVTWKIELL